MSNRPSPQRAIGHPIDLRPLFASLRKPATDRLHLTRDQFIVLTLLRTYTRPDGWSTEPGQDGWSHRAIGRMTGTSQAYAKHVVRDMRRRRILQSDAEHADGKDGVENALRVNSPAEWTLLTAEQKKPRPKSTTVRVQQRDGRLRIAIPGRGVHEVDGEPEARIGAVGAATAITVRGGFSVRIPEQAAVQVDVQLQPEQAKSAQKVPGSPATPGVEKVTEPGAVGAQVVLGSPATPVPVNTQEYECPDGRLRIEWAANRRFLTGAERRELQRLIAGGATVDSLSQFFIVGGMRVTVIERRSLPSQKSDVPAIGGDSPERIVLDGAPSGVWARALHKLQGRVNPHNFTTWFLPTREAGTLEGALVIAVPTRLFVKRLRETYGAVVRDVFRAMGKADLRFQFVSVGKGAGEQPLEIVAPPDSDAQADSQEKSLQRRAS